MNFSDYVTKMRPTNFRIGTRELFVRNLLASMGCKLANEYGDDYMRRLYNGRKPLSGSIKGKLPIPIDKEGISSFLDDYFSKVSLDIVMDNFGIRGVDSPSKHSFIEALYNQLCNIVTVAETDVNDIVVSEYFRLVDEERNVILNAVNNELLKDMDNLGKLLPTIRELLKIIENHNFISEPYPAHDFFIKTDKINEYFSTMTFFNQDVSNVTEEFIKRQNSFGDYLSDITFTTDHNGYGHIRRDIGILPIGVKFEDIEDRVWHMHLALRLSIEKILMLENTLKKELMNIANFLCSPKETC